MKQIYFLRILLLFTFLTNAQIKVQGVIRYDLKQNPTAKTVNNKSVATTTDFDAIKYWVGTGANKAALVIQWNDGKNSDALVWGYRWDGTATGVDMVKAIAKADHRFYALQYYSGPDLGTAIGGLGFDLNGTNTIGLYKDGNVIYPHYPENGIVNTSGYDFDSYTAIDAADHWQSGWASNGYWSYWVKNPADTDFDYSSLGATSRVLENGSWDAWTYNPSFEQFPIASTLTPVTPYVSATDFTKGYFMVNEDWFGHTNGSVNFINANGDINYRVYSTANNNETFGITTQHGTIYGDKFYFVSKQAGDSGILVVANAKTMQKIATFNTIGGDGRSFLGVNENKGYIGASNGIYLFDIANMQVGNGISGTTGAGQIGSMIRTSQYVFATTQNKGILIIDPTTNTVIKTITGGFQSVVQAKDGSVWAIQNQKLINIDATTFATTEYAIPTTKYFTSWGAWNAGSFTYSNQQNALYWINSISSFTSGSQIVRFDVASKTFNENFGAIPGQTTPYRQIPYGSALRIDPISDELILNTTESGFSSHFQKNWIHTYASTGTLTNTKILNDYYWFPSVTVFPDNSAPVVSTTLPSQVSIKSATIIDLKTVVSDTDNLSAAIVKSIKSNNNPALISAVINTKDELVLTPQHLEGEATVVISFNSNGKVVEKSIAVTVTNTLGTDTFERIEFTIYPNPVSDVLTIKTQDEVLNVIIYDISGKLINTRINNNQIDVSALTKGFYIINVVTDRASYQQKFIKK
ncbi:DUF5074 domain-containing protein [Flavobacterium sp. F-65]|uniref:DUF5074 domain-containing protein n=1 Tax=Flavobacterium pisciphilum TaxID=2893755 RepID=A0ABS8N0A7_9FLAO|nr:DUF5074 domain-containing protein [Flavobacterium sp. F-65]MCC9074442.1 DUF5074 domain-containing protein [Flavobacterium sp. F-65]